MNLLHILCKEYIVSNGYFHEFLKKQENDLPNSFLIKRDKFLHDLALSCIKQIDSMLLCICLVIDHTRDL